MLLIENLGCLRHLIFMKQDGEQKDECMWHKLEQLISVSFIYFFTNKSVVFIFLNG